MNPVDLHHLLRQRENPKLDFKRTLNLNSDPPEGTDRQLWREYVRGQWDELIKDLLSLANGHFGYENVPGYLLIGVGDDVDATGNRPLFDTSTLIVADAQVQAKVNHACAPPVPEIHVEHLRAAGAVVTAIEIPPTPYLHETTRDLRTTSGAFDSTGRLQHCRTDSNYSVGTVFVRRGDTIHPATSQEREALSRAKAQVSRLERLRESRNAIASVLVLFSRAAFYAPAHAEKWIAMKAAIRETRLALQQSHVHRAGAAVADACHEIITILVRAEHGLRAASSGRDLIDSSIKSRRRIEELLAIVRAERDKLDKEIGDPYW